MISRFKKLTNNQKFVYNLYRKHEQTILEYLKLQDARREYQDKVHKVEYSTYTYTQKESQLGIIEDIEAKLKSYGISILKLHKINRYIKKFQCGKEVPDSLDFLTEYFMRLFFDKSFKLKFREVKPSDYQISKYQKFKALKRQRAQKSLNTGVQARIVTRRLMRLYKTLYPQGNEPLKFVAKVMYDIENGNEKEVEALIKKAKAINPRYNYY